ncbi:MAG TPA: septal ring lytic transglycosylase RlpA family protein [Thermoanaerobaculia bacterium]|nr:septal ring lytic transglycosylase RlpA family protein [Thermoanaerobaculia bacterium]
MKRLLCALLLMLLMAACKTTTTTTATAAPPPPKPAPVLAGMSDTHGMAGWYGQEFAGRTTANGEIFDPLIMTAAHRTLPFGTIVDVKNAKTGAMVRVRVNDRGPYVGNRLIDLSYAAAQQIGLVDTGGGEVDIAVVRLGKGEREPPAPYNVAVVGPTAAGQPAVEPPKVEVVPAPPPVTVENLQVIEEHKGVETRRQVSPSGKTVETVPVPQPPAPAPAPAPVPRPTVVTPQPKPAPPPASAPAPALARTGHYAVQVGAFSIEANAKALQERLTKLGEQATIHKTTLYLVRIGPFETKEQAIKVRERLEKAGISAIIVTM